MLSKFVNFYHFNSTFQRFKSFVRETRATAWLLPLFRFGVSQIRRQVHVSMVSKGSRKTRFQKIYEYNMWADDESVSGEGSNYHYTSKIRAALPTLLEKFNIQSIVDAPCGDFYWMKFVMRDKSIRYLGLDIVDELIDKNNATYRSETVQFSVGDICEDHIPACDLLMTRDCLFHLSLVDIDRFLKNLANVDYKYFLTTSHLGGSEDLNTDIQSGDFRCIDLFRAPFTFQHDAVLDRFDDYPDGHPLRREMVLFAKKDVPTSLVLE